MRTLESLDFRSLTRAAVAGGLEAAAVFDVDAKPLAVTGALDDVDARASAAVITSCAQSPDVLARMLAGELIEFVLDARVIAIGIAARCVFVAAVPTRQLHGPPGAVESFRFQVERLISDARGDFSGARAAEGGAGGSSSGPAELPAVDPFDHVRPRK